MCGDRAPSVRDPRGYEEIKAQCDERGSDHLHCFTQHETDMVVKRQGPRTIKGDPEGIPSSRSLAEPRSDEHSCGMRVTAWSNGAPQSSGAGYGVRLTSADRAHYFERTWERVSIVTPTESVEVSLSPSFWRGCPELRSATIGRWLIAEGHAPWPKGKPPGLVLESLGGRRFSLSVI